MKNGADIAKRERRSGAEGAGGFFEYGKKLQKLGKKMQNPKTSLGDLVKDLMSLGLMMSFRVEPDPKASVDMTVDLVDSEHF